MSFSFAPADAIQGGLPSNIDVRVESSRIEIYTYPKTGDQTTALIWNLLPLDGSTSTFEQVYSMGSITRIIPTEDSESVQSVNEASKIDSLTKLANCYHLMAELVACGYPEDRLRDAKASSFVGLEFHGVRKKYARENMQNDKSDKDSTEVFVPSKLITLPGEKSRRVAAAPKAKPSASNPGVVSGAPTVNQAAQAAGGNGSGNGTAPDPAANPNADAVLGLVQEFLSTAPDKTAPFLAVKKAVFTKLANLKPADRAPAVKLLDNADWLANNGIMVDAAAGTLAAL